MLSLSLKVFAACTIFLGRTVGSWENSPAIFTAEAKSTGEEFKVYWNSPTFQCHKYGLMFDDLTRNYGIVTNNGGSFRGNFISILYDPGKFPALLKQRNGNELYRRNGGVPQEGNLREHLDEFRKQLEELIPDGAFSGIGIIDFESWRPIFRQNFGTLKPYQDLSYKIEKEKHPFWMDKWVKNEAERRFEEYAAPFMRETLKVAKEARPLARWGYYAYPYCFNMNGNNKNPSCPNNVVDENNRVQWLWDESDAFFPSLYFNKNKLNANERLQMVKGRVHEARRISSKTNWRHSIYPYLWYKYQDDTDTFVTQSDMYNALQHIKNSNLNGAILWGSSNDVDTQEKCILLDEHIRKILGPVVKSFVRTSRSMENATVYEEISFAQAEDIPEW